MKVFYGVVLIVLVTLFSCKKEEATCGFTNPTKIATTVETDSLRKILVQQGISATQHSSGIFYVINTAGTGATPGICSYISTVYTGKLLSNGSVFDTNTAAFTLGMLIDGCQYGLKLIQAGGSISLFIPPSLGYGATAQTNSQGTVIIPANSYLRFDFQLQTVQ